MVDTPISAPPKARALRLVAQAYVEPLRHFPDLVRLIGVVLTAVICFTIVEQSISRLAIVGPDRLSRAKSLGLLVLALVIGLVFAAFLLGQSIRATSRWQSTVVRRGPVLGRPVSFDDNGYAFLTWSWWFLGWAVFEIPIIFRSVDRLSGAALIARTVIDSLVLIGATAAFAYLAATGLLKASDREMSGTVSAAPPLMPAGFRTGIVLAIVPLVIGSMVPARFGFDYRLLSIDPRFGRLLVERTGIALAFVVFVTYLALVYRDSQPVAQEDTS